MDYERRLKRINTTHTVGWLDGIQRGNRPHLEDTIFERMAYEQGYTTGWLIRIGKKLWM